MSVKPCRECGDPAWSETGHPDLCTLCADRAGLWTPAEPDDSDALYQRTARWRSWPDVDSAPLVTREADTTWGKGRVA